MSDEAIRLSGVSKAYSGHLAVQDLSLSVPRGGAFGLLGPNGAGKTTTLRMVMNILAPDTGHDRDPRASRPTPQTRATASATCPRSAGSIRAWCWRSSSCSSPRSRACRRKEAARRLPPWLERLGLADWRRRKLNELSKGMQQKAQFIATVLHEPEILILDEPLSGLDPVAVNLDARRASWTCAAAARRIVLSSHQMETVERLCDSHRPHPPRAEGARGAGERGQEPPRQEHDRARLRRRRRLPGHRARECRRSATSAATSRSAWRTAPTRSAILAEAAARLEGQPLRGGGAEPPRHLRGARDRRRPRPRMSRMGRSWRAASTSSACARRRS